MTDPLNSALVLLEHAARGEGNVELDKAQAAALLVDRNALFQLAKQLKASERRLVEAIQGVVAYWSCPPSCNANEDVGHCCCWKFELCEALEKAVKP